MSNPDKQKERLRISLFHHNRLNYGGGEERAILNYARNLPRDLYDLTIYQTDYYRRLDLSDEEVNSYLNGIKIITLKSIMSNFRVKDLISSDAGKITKFFAQAFYLFLKVFMTGMFSKIANRKKTRDVKTSDIVFIYDAEYAGYIPSLSSSIPKVGTFRRDFKSSSTQPDWSLKKRVIYTAIRVVYSYLLRRISAFHYLTKRHFENSPIHRTRDFVLQSGVDLTIFHPPKEKRTGRLKFLFVARLERVKGIVETIKAFEELGKGDFELHIAGTGTLQSFVKSKSEKNDRIYYEGYLTGNALTDLYRKCDIFVFPTRMSEQHPLVVVEAIASGLRVLTSTELIGIFDEFQKLGLLEYIDPEHSAISLKMKEFVNRVQELRSEVSQRSQIIERYGWTDITMRLFAKLAEVAGYPKE